MSGSSSANARLGTRRAASIAFVAPSLAAASLAASLATASAAYAGGSATIKDRIDQIIDTFTGNPAADVDIDMKHVLDTWRDMHPKPLETLSAEDARRQPTPIEAAAILLKKSGKTLDPFDITVKDVSFRAADGSELKARIYAPAKTLPKTLPTTPTDSATEPRPVVLFYHGGGFVLENGASTDASSRAIAGTGGFIVVAPDYRLAPEHKFPAAQEDSIAAYKWVLENAKTFGGDPNLVALSGEGAGGMLAADTAIAARDAHLPKAKALVLITPATGIDLKTNSWIEDSAARPWNDKAVAWALNLYLPKPEDKNDPRIDLVGKADADDLPPTTIVTAEIDPLRSDGERFGGKLKRATVTASMRDYPGVTHDFFGMGAAVERAAEAQRFVADALQAAFKPAVGPTLALEDMGIATYRQAPDPAAASVAHSTPNIAAPQVSKPGP